MGIFSMIARRKEAFQKTKEAINKSQVEIAMGKLQRQEQRNARVAQLSEAKQKLRDARQIEADLKADQMRQVDKGPSKLKQLGQGLAGHMNKAKVGSAKRGKLTQPPMVGVPTSVQNQPASTQQGGIFGGQRNLDVGGEKGSPFNQQKPKRLF